MKKILLFAFLGIVALTVSAQSQKLTRPQCLPPWKLQPNYLNDNAMVPKRQPLMIGNAASTQGQSASSRTVSKMLICSSTNLNGLLVSGQQIVTANSALNMISMTNRECNSYVVAGGNTGIIQSTFSKDGGITWDSSTAFIYKGVAPYVSGRYPQGGIFNPEGNTDPNMAFAVCSGPIVESDWIANYFASTHFDGSNDSSTVFDNTISPVLENMPRYDFSIGGNNCYAVGSNQVVSSVVGGSGPFYGAVVNKGVYNAPNNDFDWNQTVVDGHWIVSPLDGTTDVFEFANMGWSADGQTGYVIFYGVDTVYQPTSFVPIVYKSTDAGESWTEMPDFDWGSIPAFQENLFPASDGNIHPWFYPFDNGSDVAVDKDGNLHIVCEVISGATGNLDSAAYFLADANGNYPQQFFDTYTGTDGSWNARLIDTVKAIPVLAGGSSPYSDLGLDARVQIASNEARDKFFMVYMDTDPIIGTENLAPDIFGIGWDLDGHKTAVKNFTAGTNYASLNFWLCVSNKVLEDGNGNYSIPVTTSFSQKGQYVSTDPTNHYYVSGIDFSDADFPVGIPTINKNDPSVNIYPNPSDGRFVIDLTGVKSNTATVTVSNLMGQQMKVMKGQKILDSQLPVNLNSLNSGVYFLTIETSGKVLTKKVTIYHD